DQSRPVTIQRDTRRPAIDRYRTRKPFLLTRGRAPVEHAAIVPCVENRERAIDIQPRNVAPVVAEFQMESLITCAEDLRRGRLVRQSPHADDSQLITGNETPAVRSKRDRTDGARVPTERRRLLASGAVDEMK